MSFFSKLLNKFNNSSTAKTVQYLDLSDLAELEELLISADLGPELSMDLVDSLRKHISGVAGIGANKITKEELPEFFANLLRKDFEEVAKNASGTWFQGQLPWLKDTATPKQESLVAKQTIITLVGVNGVGKTTSAAKLACKYKQEGHKVLLVAADTFRAAATEQLRELATRVGVDIITAESEKEKASAVVYRALQASQGEVSNDCNFIIIDTAGRLQNKSDLMLELSKLTEVIRKNSQAKLEMFLVLDASTGQNAISQAELFNAAVAGETDSALSGVILTKYDGSSKAGIVIALARKFKLAVKFVGTGEGIEDLKEFNLDDFISQIL